MLKILHGDLATRNILLAEDNIVKICDFGFAKTMYNSENYKKKSDKVCYFKLKYQNVINILFMIKLFSILGSIAGKMDGN